MIIEPKSMKKIASLFILLAFVCNCIMPSLVFAQALNLPEPGTMVALSSAFTPAHLTGMVINPKNPFKFDFIIYRGDTPLPAEQKHPEYTKLIKYFLAAVAIPDTEQWVNLSPYEKDRIIPDNFGKTEMGRDLLSQDYILKQLASSLTSPDSELGKKFWDKVYERAYQKFGNTNIPPDTFNKVWIVPNKAVIYEKGNTVYVLEHHLKVMMEADYLAMKNNVIASGAATEAGELLGKVMREVIIPAIEKEVNEGKNFDQLRQVYSGMLLAAWYKRALKESILTKVYGDRSKVKGIDQDPKNNQQIYDQYVAAFKKGVFSMIKEDVDKYTQEVIPRKYFSGGAVADGAMYSKIVTMVDVLPAQAYKDAAMADVASVVVENAYKDAAMLLQPVDSYEDFYNRFGMKDHSLGDGNITQEAVNSFSLKFLTADAELLPPVQRRLNETWGVENEPYGITEVYFVPEGETQRRMVAFQHELKQMFGNKVYLVDADKLHFTTQGLEQQWEDNEKGTKKPLALHSGLDRIDKNKGAILQVREKARSITTPAVKIQVAKLNYNPQTGIFWQLRPYLPDPLNDPIRQRRRAWGLPEPRPPHITAAYFTQSFSVQEEVRLRALLLKYSDVTHFGDIEVNKVQVIAYSNFAFNASRFDQGYIVLETVSLTTDTIYHDGEKVSRSAIDFRSQFSANYKGSPTEANILGLASGNAEDELFLSRQGYHVVASDLTDSKMQPNLKIAQKEGLSLDGKTIDITKKLPYADGTFDAVYIRLGTHYLTNGQIAQLSGELRRVIKNNGFVYIVAKSKEDFYYKQFGGREGADGLVTYIDPLDHKQYSRNYLSGGNLTDLFPQFHPVSISRYTERLYTDQHDSDLITFIAVPLHVDSAQANESSSSFSQSNTKGGIDLNSSNLDLQIKRDGNGVPLPVSQQNLDNIRIDGLVPVILDIEPAMTLPLFTEPASAAL